MPTKTLRDRCAEMPFPVPGSTHGLMRVRDAAELLQVDRRTVYKLIDSGVLPSVRLTPTLIRVSRFHVSILTDLDGSPR